MREPSRAKGPNSAVTITMAILPPVISEGERTTPESLNMFVNICCDDRALSPVSAKPITNPTPMSGLLRTP